MYKTFFIALEIGMVTACCSESTDKRTYQYPAARQENIREDYHGVSVNDPYRWLEEPLSQETNQWVAAQQKITDKFLSHFPDREKIRTQLTHLLNFRRYSLPNKAGDYYFYWRNDGLQNQSVLYRSRDLSGIPEIVIDPNTFSKDGTVAIDATFLTKDGTLLVYTVATHGSDWKEIKILNVSTGELYPETIGNCKHSSAAWKKDNSGFYYNRFVREGGLEDGVYWHTLGSDPSQDLLVYKNHDPQEVHSAGVTEDGNYVLLYTSRGCSEKNAIAFRPIDSVEEFTPIFDKFDSQYAFCGNIGSLFYFFTDQAAERGRIITINVAEDIARWHTLIPEGAEILTSASIINQHLICNFRSHALDNIKIYDLKGNFLSTLPLPTVGSAGYSGNQDNEDLFVALTSFLYPSTIFKYDFINNSLNKVWDCGADFEANLYETKQIFYTSADGTQVRMFISHKKGLALDGNNPTLLYGYGGFNVSLTPFFSTSVLLWLEQGGVFAVANIRGGDEYGAPWHEQAILGNRQRAFDDFIAAGEWLVSNNYTSSNLLAINGGSNGGLLVGVCMQQRPDLFGAVISEVPVTDMLRFHKFTAGRYWVTEYGDVNNPADFESMYAYSPLHTVKEGVAYPPLLVTSADTDDRVVPMHSKKWVARLQEASKGNNLVLLRYETAAGHGAGKPTSKRIDESTDKYTFLFKIFGMAFK